MTNHNTPLETLCAIGHDLVEHCNARTTDDFIAHDSKLWERHYADSWVAIEGDGRVARGREEVEKKYREWMSMFRCHASNATGPFVGPDGFSVIFDVDVEGRDGSMPRMQMREVACYTVEDGKIVREEFCFLPRF